MNQHGVLADESQAGLLRVAAFQDRAGIDIDFLIELVSLRLRQPFSKFLQAQLDHIVIIHTPGIRRNSTASRIAKQGFIGVARIIIHAHHDQRFRRRHDLTQILTAPDPIRARQIAHFALHAVLDPAHIGGERGGGLRGRHTAQVEANFLCFALDARGC